MEPNLVRVGDIFINLSMLLWAEIYTFSDNERTINLVYGPKDQGFQEFTLEIKHPESEQIIRYLESNSQDLR